MVVCYKKDIRKEGETMRGKITKMNAFKSGLGFFIGIDNGRSDYLCNGNPNVKVGDEVEYDTGEPTKDGKPTITSIRRNTIEAFIDADKPRSAKIEYRAHDYPQWQQEKDEKRQKLRLECVRIAATCLQFGGDEARLFKLADKIEEYIRR